MPAYRLSSRLLLPIAAMAAATALVLTGCTANDSLATQYRSGNGQNYIAGDGTVSEYAAANRGAPVSFTGTLQDGAPSARRSTPVRSSS